MNYLDVLIDALLKAKEIQESPDWEEEYHKLRIAGENMYELMGRITWTDMSGAFEVMKNWRKVVDKND